MLRFLMVLLRGNMLKKFLVAPILICICAFMMVACNTPEDVVPEPTLPIATVPAKPTATAMPFDNGRKISVTWTASEDDGGLPVLGFVVGICEGEYEGIDCVHGAIDVYKWTTISTSAKQDSTVLKSTKFSNNLNLKKTYTIRVRSFNAIGESTCFWITNAKTCLCQG